MRRFLSRATAGTVTFLAAGLPLVVAAAPAQMQAIVQHGFGGPEVLKLERVPVPSPGPGQVRVHVYAAGVNPADWRSRLRPPPVQAAGAAGGSAGAAEPAPTTSGRAGAPISIPGMEVAGVIDALGPGVSGYSIGEAIYGRIASMHGGYAQYALIGIDSIAPKPRRLTFEQAAGAAEVARTVLRALDDGHVQAGQTVVIVGAAGGLGSAAVQLAKDRGARIIAIASSSHNAYLRSLGADRIANYDRADSLATVRGADAVINTAESQGSAALAYARRGGTLLDMAGSPGPGQCDAAGVSCPLEQGLQATQRSGISDAQRLAELNRRILAGRFTIHVEKIYPLAQAADAQEFNRAGHAEGKLVLVVTPAAER